MKVLLTKKFTFEASHQLPYHDGKCRRLHGHSWKLSVTVEADVQEVSTSNSESGMGMDYFWIKETVGPIVESLDHHHLGGWIDVKDPNVAGLQPTVEEMPLDFYPTSEMLLVWIANQLPIEFPWYILVLEETCTVEAALFRRALEKSCAQVLEMVERQPELAPKEPDDIPY